jgi:hypothetical protein
MTARIEKTVFISYRRTNFWTALAVFQNLNSNGYDVFFDYKSIPSGDFAQVIDENVKSRAHFIVILSPSALERCNEPGDWLRREIETAIDSKRNIIPLIMEGFDFGSTTTINALTGKLASLKNYNGIGIPVEYFDEAMAKLRSERFLNRPLESVAHPISDITKNRTEEQKIAANEAVPVDKEKLMVEGALEELNLSTTVFDTLKRSGITSVENLLDLLEKGESAVMSNRNFGEKSLDELRQKMQKRGYHKDES